MKNFLILLLFLSVGFSQEEIQDGPFTTYNEDGEIISKGNYKNGKKHGEFYTYSFGWKITSNYINGLQDGPQVSKVVDGQVIVVNYKDGKPHGLTQRYDVFGNLSLQQNYKDGKQHGPGFSYYMIDGVRKGIKWKGQYKNDKKIGVHTYYFENGNIRQQTSYSDE